MIYSESVICPVKIPANSKNLILAVDASATNVCGVLYSENKDGGITPVAGKKYQGQKISDFSQVVEDILFSGGSLNTRDISMMVLGAAGPVTDSRQRCEMTNAPFSLEASAYGIPTILINDFEAISSAVSYLLANNIPINSLDHIMSFSAVPLGNARTNPGTRMASEGKVGILGAGTGLGSGFLVPDSVTGIGLPQSSEGGHRALAVMPNNPEHVAIAGYLAKSVNSDIPELETLLCGRGIERVFNYFRDHYNLDKTNDPRLRKLDAAPDKAAYIAQAAKEDSSSYYRTAMHFFWTYYGLALRDLALDVLATGGMFIGGGIIRKNILTRNGTVDSSAEEPMMTRFYSHHSPNHKAFLQETTVIAITDPLIGVKGALAVSLSPELKHYFGYLRG